MKLFEKVLAILLAGIFSVFVMQQLIRRWYCRWHRAYICANPDDNFVKNPTEGGEAKKIS